MTARRRNQVSQLELMNKDSMNMSWSLENRLKLALAAVEFFDFNTRNRKRIARLLPNEGRGARAKRTDFSLLDFFQYLEARSLFPRKPNHFRVQHIVTRMASLGFLVPMGYSGPGVQPFCERYMCLHGMYGEHFRGNLWLAPLLGPELLYHEAKPSVVHITGTRDGRAVAGSGVVIHPNYVLTCRHVLDGMEIEPCQSFQGKECAVDSKAIRLHPTEDVAIIGIDDRLTPLNGAVFRKPIIGQGVYTMGYPKLPNTRDATLTMQAGAVTNERVTTLGGQALFLYSAISRPGNSGGPVLADDGYLVGIAAEDHVGRYADDGPFSPHYAAVPANVVVRAIEELAPDADIQLVVEKIE